MIRPGEERTRILVPGLEGGWTTLQPSARQATIDEAAREYAASGTPLVIVAGAEYGSGSSRDWAAKGTALRRFLPGA